MALLGELCSRVSSEYERMLKKTVTIYLSFTVVCCAVGGFYGSRPCVRMEAGIHAGARFFLKEQCSGNFRVLGCICRRGNYHWTSPTDLEKYHWTSPTDHFL